MYLALAAGISLQALRHFGIEHLTFFDSRVCAHHRQEHLSVLGAIDITAYVILTRTCINIIGSHLQAIIDGASAAFAASYCNNALIPPPATIWLTSD